MEQATDWKRLADGYGRDYGWLEKAMQLYPCRTAGDGQRATVCFFPGESPEDDFGVPYGMPAGLCYCFLLEAAPQQETKLRQEEKTLWLPLLADAAGRQSTGTVYCVPVKSGRPALGWQLGLFLTAIRPLALLRPFYLFSPAQPVTAQPCRTVPLADARRLGRLLEDGWCGVGCDGTGTQVTLHRPANGTRFEW